ncbi:MAG: heterodisulfide reductase subunit [Clostridia bacterium]|nr:heterodisulfide reductase subunit [Clostridia bacterium]
MEIAVSRRSPLEDAGILREAAACFQCGRCTGGCPVAFAAPETPRQIIRLLQLGAWERALASPTIWICAGCYSCTAECPRGVDLQGLMVRLKVIAMYREDCKGEAAFYRAFLGGIRRRGRIFEPELVLAYGRQAGIKALWQQARPGMKMLWRGQIPLRPMKIRDYAQLGALLDELAKGEGGK